MRTAAGTECGSNHHDRNGRAGAARYDVLEIAGRRYTVCAHRVGERGYCGQLIDVTDLPAVVICCGNDRNHDAQPVLGVD